MSDLVLYDVKDGVGVITMNRPEARNALTFEMYDRIAEICAAPSPDGSVKALIVTGAGEKAFAAGTDHLAVRDTRDLLRLDLGDPEEPRQRRWRRASLPPPDGCRVAGARCVLAIFGRFRVRLRLQTRELFLVLSALFPQPLVLRRQVGDFAFEAIFLLFGLRLQVGRPTVGLIESHARLAESGVAGRHIFN
ncbi:MAG: hypothetical protein HC850_05470 [Rhodomicrobium sp.]|nr:hypothetical protein [Rhodomicrobium sp.]